MYRNHGRWIERHINDGNWTERRKSEFSCTGRDGYETS